MNNACFRSIGEASASAELGNFKVLIGKKTANLLPYTVWLLNTIDDFQEDMVDDVLFSGVRLGMTYPMWLCLSDFVREKLNETAKVFQSFHEMWGFPFRWKVFPVASGYLMGGANWCFHIGSDTKVLVAGKTKFDSAFHLSAEAFPVSHLLLFDPRVMQTDVDAILNAMRTHTNTVRVTVRDPIVASALIIQAAHALTDFDSPAVVLLGDHQLDIVHSCFEWLSVDLQVYVEKVVTRATKLNSACVVLSDLIESGRVLLCRKSSQIPSNAKLVVTREDGPDQLNLEACTSELTLIQDKYSPQILTSRSEISISNTIQENPRHHEGDEILKQLTLRYADIHMHSPSIISIPSLAATSIDFGEMEIVSSVVKDEDLAELVHIALG